MTYCDPISLCATPNFRLLVPAYVWRAYWLWSMLLLPSCIKHAIKSSFFKRMGRRIKFEIQVLLGIQCMYMSRKEKQLEIVQKQRTTAVSPTSVCIMDAVHYDSEWRTNLLGLTHLESCVECSTSSAFACCIHSWKQLQYLTTDIRWGPRAWLVKHKKWP